MSDAAVLRMSKTDKIAESMRRSLPHLPSEARHVVEGMIRPETIALVSGTLIVWAGSHFFGVGEIVDLLLLGVGVAALGFAVFEGAGELLEFATTALNANSPAQLDNAAQHFARAVTLLGISTIQAVLLRGQVRPVVAPWTTTDVSTAAGGPTTTGWQSAASQPTGVDPDGRGRPYVTLWCDYCISQSIAQ